MLRSNIRDVIFSAPNDHLNEHFNMTTGPVLEMLMEFPEGILEDSKVSFHQFLKKLYNDRTGFVKGKYLVMSIELLFRQCEGDKAMFLKVLSAAYSLVESQ